MKKDLDRSCLTRKVLIEKIGHSDLNIFVSPGIYTIECDINTWLPTIGASMNELVRIPVEYLGNTQSRSSAGLEHHVDNLHSNFTF